ncbi:hypothetical protein IT414_04430 [bacterium]|nr:hypothetical protein [bacterium]
MNTELMRAHAALISNQCQLADVRDAMASLAPGEFVALESLKTERDTLMQERTKLLRNYRQLGGTQIKS